MILALQINQNFSPKVVSLFNQVVRDADRNTYAGVSNIKNETKIKEKREKRLIIK